MVAFIYIYSLEDAFLKSDLKVEKKTTILSYRSHVFSNVSVTTKDTVQSLSGRQFLP